MTNIRDRSLGAVVFVVGDQFGRDRCGEVEALVFLVVGDRHVEGAEDLRELGRARVCQASRRSGTASSIAATSSGSWPAGRSTWRLLIASVTALLRVLSSSIRSVASATTGCVGSSCSSRRSVCARSERLMATSSPSSRSRSALCSSQVDEVALASSSLRRWRRSGPNTRRARSAGR